jgi:hypothetical protein
MVPLQSLQQAPYKNSRRGSTFDSSIIDGKGSEMKFHEDLSMISTIFDKDLFDRISDFDHIK